MAKKGNKKKDYSSEVRKHDGKKGDAKRKAIHKMVESLIKGDSKAAAEELHNYLEVKTREIILGEKKDKPDFLDVDKDGDKDEDMEDAVKDKKKSKKKDDDDDSDDDDDDDSDDDKDDKKKSKKKDDDKMDESSHVKGNFLSDTPKKSNDTKSTSGLKSDKGFKHTQSGKIKGNSIKDKPKKSNDTKAHGGDWLPDQGDKSVKGNSLKDKPKTSNDTKATKAKVLK